MERDFDIPAAASLRSGMTKSDRQTSLEVAIGAAYNNVDRSGLLLERVANVLRRLRGPSDRPGRDGIKGPGTEVGGAFTTLHSHLAQTDMNHTAILELINQLDEFV